jgi:uracil DNA glycosylase
MKKVGIIGYNKGNGHPFSFSAIINNYNKKSFEKCGWEIILRYLNKRKKKEFGIKNLKVTHVYMPQKKMAYALAEACYVENVCNKYSDMIKEVDAVIIARDDYKSHHKIALPFLKANKYVFIDKPLSLNVKELNDFFPYVKSGKLMSCAAYKYADELNYIKKELKNDDEVKNISLITLKSWEKYGIHVIDAFFEVTKLKTVSVSYKKFYDDFYFLKLENGAIVTICCTKKYRNPNFVFSIISEKKNLQIKISDNFSAFKKTLNLFSKMINEKVQATDISDIKNSMYTLIAGNLSKKFNKEIIINKDLEKYYVDKKAKDTK